MPKSQYRYDETKWLADNRAWLEANHAGEWVALQGYGLTAAGPDLQQVLAEARAQGVEHPLVTAIRRKEYQGAILVRSPRLQR